MAYSKEEIEVFRRKDRQQAKGFAVTQAIEILKAGRTVEEVLETANKITEYTAKELFAGDAPKVDTPKEETPKKETPKRGRPPKTDKTKESEMSAAAAKIFDELVKEYSKVGEVDIDKLKAEILREFKRFPTKATSIPAVLKAIKPEQVIKGD